MSMRCEEPGWVMINSTDYRRAVWVRLDLEKGSIEFCAGREGDDAHVKIDFERDVSVESDRVVWDDLARLFFDYWNDRG